MGCVFLLLVFGTITLVTPSSGGLQKSHPTDKNEDLPAFHLEQDGIEIEAPEFVQNINDEDETVMNGDDETNSPVLQTRGRGGRGDSNVNRDGGNSVGPDGFGPKGGSPRKAGRGTDSRGGRGGRGHRSNVGTKSSGNLDSTRRTSKATGDGARRQKDAAYASGQKNEAEDREGRMLDEAEERARVTREEVERRTNGIKKNAEKRAGKSGIWH